ncbi:MAG: peptidoglycan editing factor PgeF [Alphaproteobacteria bacterium]|nr:MAG: peptidoglycan editing factor PgeF [Alphaproteobacteria bacterium]
MTLFKHHAKTLNQLPHVIHGFYGRKGGVSEGIFASLNCGPGSGDDPAKVTENRARVARDIGVEAPRLLTLYQIHSPKVVTVTEPWAPEDRPQADAMVTNQPGLALGILTADCGPLLFADAEAGVIGAAHSGWQGALSGVLEATLTAMEELGADRARIHAALGPTISQTAYEVGPEFRERFLNENKDFERFFESSSRADHAQFDLPGFIAAAAQGAGLASFEDLALCTYGDEAGLFSYRRTTHLGEPDYGRNISVIALQAAP